MKTFPYVEDYLEVINGDRDPVTGKLLGLFNTTPPIIQLARYDVKVLDSMSQSTQCQNPLTDRQAELACKIILKYRKQLASKYIDVSPVENPKFRNPLREIDRTCSLTLSNDSLILKFPYDTKLIESMRELSKLSNGRWHFDKNNKSWRIGLTETNVIAAHGFATNNQFEINPSVVELVEKILAVENNPYDIKLIQTDSGYCVTNAAPSLTDYIENNIGKDNVISIVDHSAILGFDVDRMIEEDVIDHYSPRVYNLLRNIELKFSPTSMGSETFEEIITYCDITNRYPIYVYEPDMSDKLYNNFVLKYFDPSQVHRVTGTKNLDIPDSAKVVFFNKYNAGWQNDIPLLISSAGMMHGGEKTILLQRARKVVYFATEVYNIKNIKKR